MKRSALALGVLLALGLGWLVWSSRAPHAQQVVSPTTPVSGPAPASKSAALVRVPEAAPAPLRSGPEPRPAAAPRDATPVDSAEVLVRGSVRDEQGNPVASAQLSWTEDRGLLICSGVTDGSYSTPGLHPGHLLVELGGWGWRTEQFDLELAPRPEVQQRDFTLHACPRVLIKLVEPDGTPAFGDGHEIHPGNRARVVASKQALGTLEAALRDSVVYESDCGRFENRWELRYRLNDLAPDVFGILELRADPPLCVSLVLGSAVLESRTLNEIPGELVFRQRTEDLQSAVGGLRARLLQPDGRTPAAKGSAMLQSESSASAVTDVEGRVEFRGLQAGSYTLWLGGERGSSLSRSVELEARKVLDLGDVTLAPSASVSLRFEFHAGSQTSVQYVLKPEVAGDPQGALGTNDNSMFSTGERNPSSLAFPGPGSYVLRVIEVGEIHSREKAHLGARPKRIVFADRPEGEVVVAIEATTEICLRPPRESDGITRWLVSTADGVPCLRVRIRGRAPTRVELVPGEYTIARLDPETRAIGRVQAFAVGSQFSTVELQP